MASPISDGAGVVMMVLITIQKATAAKITGVTG
jgi:hypothetical protein